MMAMTTVGVPAALAAAGRGAARYGAAGRGALLAANTLLLGNDLLAWLVLALGGAMVAGNVMALIRPPARPRQGELMRAPFGRSALYLVIGAMASIWALATLLRG
jgi:hypothetical protein